MLLNAMIGNIQHDCVQCAIGILCQYYIHHAELGISVLLLHIQLFHAIMISLRKLMSVLLFLVVSASEESRQLMSSGTQFHWTNCGKLQLYIHIYTTIHCAINIINTCTCITKGAANDILTIKNITIDSLRPGHTHHTNLTGIISKSQNIAVDSQSDVFICSIDS